MGIRSNTDPYSNKTLLVNQVIGEPYKKVRTVAENIEFVKQVAENLSEMVQLHGSIESVEFLAAQIEHLDTVAADTTELKDVADNILALIAISQNLLALNGVHSSLAAINNVSNVISDVSAVHNNLDELVEISSNLDGLLQVYSVIADTQIIINAVESAELAAERAETAANGVSSPVSFLPQTLSTVEQDQARSNIGVINTTTVSVGVSVAGADEEVLFGENDSVTGTLESSSTLVRWTWDSIKTWIRGWITQTDVGLGNVNNTSDADKPVSTATQNALNLKVDLDSPSFTGTASFETITASGNITAYSDERLKENISTISGALELVNSMRGVNYTRKDGGQNQIGVIAQEVQKVLPEVVLEGSDEDRTLSVSYGNIVGVLIEAIKELKSELDEVKKSMGNV